ncbi:hypothetical protein [Xenorhabdus poinarii]
MMISSQLTAQFMAQDMSCTGQDGNDVAEYRYDNLYHLCDLNDDDSDDL